MLRSHVAQGFFDCLKGDNCAAAIWYRGIRSKIERVVFTRQARFSPPTRAFALASAWPTHAQSARALFSLCPLTLPLPGTHWRERRQFGVSHLPVHAAGLVPGFLPLRHAGGSPAPPSGDVVVARRWPVRRGLAAGSRMWPAWPARRRLAPPHCSGHPHPPSKLHRQTAAIVTQGSRQAR